MKHPLKHLETLSALLISHFIVLILHTAAHIYHQLMPDLWGTILIVLGYYLLPAFGWTRLHTNSVTGLWTLLAGISVAFTHGFLYHFVFDTSDYVCYFGAHITGRWFTLTAYGLAITDFSIAIITAIALRRSLARREKIF